MTPPTTPLRDERPAPHRTDRHPPPDARERPTTPERVAAALDGVADELDARDGREYRPARLFDLRADLTCWSSEIRRQAERLRAGDDDELPPAA